MDGMHDLGGLDGFGTVVSDPTEPAFVEPWEGRVHGMMLALAVQGAVGGGFRHAIERMDPLDYLTSGYYAHWIHALETLLAAAGRAERAEIDAWQARLAAGEPMPRRADPELAEQVRSVLRPFPVDDRTEPAPRFAPGVRVRARRVSPRGHTRCPRYVRGATGTIRRVHAAQPLPDAYSADPPEMRPEPYYSVAFRLAELWGADAEQGATVTVDLWESYLEEMP